MSFLSGGSTAPQHRLPGFLAEIPTPFHVFHLARALEDARELRAGLSKGLPRLELFYSVKTNPLLPLLRGLLAESWGMEAVGKENLRAALESGAPGDRILYNGAAWTRVELERAVFELGISHFTADSLPMIKLLANVLKERPGRRIHLALRLHDGDSHFGFPGSREILVPALETPPAESVASLGFQIHCNPHGSPRTLTALLSDFRSRCNRVKAALSSLEGTPWAEKISFLDFGGGIDSPFVYRPHPSELGAFHNPNEVEIFRRTIPARRFGLREAGDAVAQVIRETLGPQWASKRILFEPGRAVCTRALSTVVEIRANKEGHYPDAQVVITDGSTAFLGPLHRGVHPVLPAGNQKTFIYGCLPHSGDWLFQSANMPALNPGDRILVEHTGAYFLPLEAQFGHGQPGIISAETKEWVRKPS